MSRHHLFNEAYANPVRPRSQMSGEQRKRSASKKSARAMAKSHRRQAGYSYDAMLEAQDDAWEGGEYQGYYAYENPFVVTPKGQAIGSHDLPTHTHLRGAALAAREGRVARGAMALEREGTTLRIKQVGNQYQIVDQYGSPTGKYAYSLNKARDMLDRMLAGLE